MNGQTGTAAKGPVACCWADTRSGQDRTNLVIGGERGLVLPTHHLLERAELGVCQVVGVALILQVLQLRTRSEERAS